MTNNTSSPFYNPMGNHPGIGPYPGFDTVSSPTNRPPAPTPAAPCSPQPAVRNLDGGLTPMPGGLGHSFDIPPSRRSPGMPPGR